MALKMAVMVSISHKFRADKMDATFKYEITARAPDLFEKLLQQFAIEDELEEEESLELPSESATVHGQSMGTMTVTTRHNKNKEVKKKPKLKELNLKELNMLEHAYT